MSPSHIAFVASFLQGKLQPKGKKDKEEQASVILAIEEEKISILDSVHRVGFETICIQSKHQCYSSFFETNQALYRISRAFYGVS